MRKSRVFTLAVAVVVFTTAIGWVMGATSAAPATSNSVLWDKVEGVAPALSPYTLTTLFVPADEVGQTCKLTMVSNNNESVHPGNTITAGPLTLVNFEDAANKPHSTAAMVVLPDHIDVVLSYVEQSSASGSLTISECVAPPPTTTPPTTTPPTTTTAPVTTTTPPVRSHVTPVLPRAVVLVPTFTG